MRKLFNSLFVIIAAMVTFAGCAKEETEAPAQTKTVQFFAESIETKTAFGTPDGTTYPTLWTANDEKVKLSLNYASPKDADIKVSDDFKTAAFSSEITDDESGAYVFYAMSPASAYNSFHQTNKYLSANIPTTQTPLADSVDEGAQVLYAISDQFSEMPLSVSLKFEHFTAYGKLSFVNLNLADAEVTSVAIASSVDFAGRWNYMVETGEFQENSGSAEITLSTSSVENLWFACAPVDMDGQTLTFTVNTTKGPLSKTVTLSDKKFEAGKIATMKVDMTGLEFKESVVYDLVTNPSELTVDSKVIIVAADYDAALSVTQNNNNRGQAGISKLEDKTVIADPGTAVQVITIEDGTKSGAVAFNVGNGYLYAASSSSNYLRTEAAVSDNSSWIVTISDGVATIVAQGANTRNTMQYNQSSSLFACYGSASQKALAIYKLRGSGTVLENYLNVSPGSIEVDADATSATFTVLSDLQWIATPSDNATVSKNGNTVIVSFVENTTADAKNYTVTVAADGVEPKTVTITQAGKVTKKTIAEVISATLDINVETEGLVVAKSTKGVIISDATGLIQVYANANVQAAIGDLVSVSGNRGAYNNWAQITSPSVTILSSNNTVTYPTVNSLDGTGMDNLLQATSVSYIQYIGTLSVSGNYYNINVEGATTAIGSAQYPLSDFGLSNLNGKKVKVSGYHVGISSSKYVNTMVTAVEVVEDTTEPEQPGDGGGESGGVASATPCYVLSENFATGSNNAYASNCDIKVGDITWNLTGNSTTTPWRMGGKSLSNTDRTLYSKTAYPNALSKVEFISGTSNLTSWNSLKLEYSTSSDFSDSQTIVASAVGASKTISFEPEGGFPENCYFRFILNVSASGSSNKYIQVSDIKFYGYTN